MLLLLLLLLVPPPLLLVPADVPPLAAVELDANVACAEPLAADVASAPVEPETLVALSANAGAASVGAGLICAAAISLTCGSGCCCARGTCCSGCWNGRLVYMMMPSNRVSIVIIYRSQFAAMFSSI